MGRVSGSCKHRVYAGVSSCYLDFQPLWTNASNGARVVPGGPSGLLVLSAVVCVIIRRGRLLPLGRIRPYMGGCGHHGRWRQDGALSCVLDAYPSRAFSANGARMVSGIPGGLLVYFAVLCMTIPWERLLLMGRIRPSWAYLW